MERNFDALKPPLARTITTYVINKYDFYKEKSLSSDTATPDRVSARPWDVPCHPSDVQGILWRQTSGVTFHDSMGQVWAVWPNLLQL